MRKRNDRLEHSYDYRIVSYSIRLSDYQKLRKEAQGLNISLAELNRRIILQHLNGVNDLFSAEENALARLMNGN